MIKLQDILGYESYLIEKRRLIHMNPESGFDVTQTAKLVASELKSFGFQVYEGVGVSSVIGVLKGKQSKKVIGLRADMDALNMTEENETISYRSQNDGKMHACGHDTHTAMLLTACKYLGNHKELVKGTLKVIFQAAEEGPYPGGGKLVIESGLLDDVEEFYAMHITNTLDEGKMMIKYGEAMAASDQFTIDIIGKGGHAAYPHLAIDPIVISAQVIMGLQTLISRVLDPTNHGVITIGVIEAGSAFNIIPNKATLKGTLRTLNEVDRSHMFQKIEDVTSHICQIYDADYQFKIGVGYPPLINHQETSAFYQNVIESSLGKDQFTISIKPSMGGEDFAYYIKKAKGTLAWIGGRNKELGYIYDNHHPRFDIDEKALIKGTLVHINTVLEFFKYIE
jgi:amidohydrolase